MPKTIIQIHSHQPYPVFTVHGPDGPGRGMQDLKSKPTDAVFVNLAKGRTADVVRLAGTKLYKTLAKHDAFTVAMQLARIATLKEEHPIYIQIEAAHPAEKLPWEALYEEAMRFLALDPRWPIGRLSSDRNEKPIRRTVETQLRMSVVMAAAGIDAIDEWNSFWDAVHTSAVPIALQVFTSQKEIHAAIEELVRSGTVAPHSIQALYTGDLTFLFSEMAKFWPNVVHFFCHGSAANVPELELESLEDRLTNKTRGSILAQSRDLKPLVSLDSLWLVTLNCCHGASSSTREPSIARQLVESGLPAAVAMREAIDPLDAFSFTNAFYRELVVELARVVRSAQSAQLGKILSFPDNLWTRVLRSPRAAIRDRYMKATTGGDAAEIHHQWTFPIIYVQSADVELVRRRTERLPPEKRAHLTAQLKLCRDTREAWERNHVPPETIQELTHEIEEIERQLTG
jgi:hypothetical protein